MHQERLFAYADTQMYRLNLSTAGVAVCYRSALLYDAAISYVTDL